MAGNSYVRCFDTPHRDDLPLAGGNAESLDRQAPSGRPGFADGMVARDNNSISLGPASVLAVMQQLARMRTPRTGPTVPADRRRVQATGA